jgi:hypothetical protein
LAVIVNGQLNQVDRSEIILQLFELFVPHTKFEDKWPLGSIFAPQRTHWLDLVTHLDDDALCGKLTKMIHEKNKN